MKLSSFSYLVKQGVNGIWKNRLMSFASFSIILVSLLMVGLSVLTTYNVNRVIQSIEDKNEVVIVVKDDATPEAIEALGVQLKNTQNISSTTFCSRDEAWSKMKDSMTSEQQDLFQYATTNPLPNSYRINLQDIGKMTATADTIKGYENVDSVKLPTEFADVLINIRTIATIISSFLIISLIIVCLVIISNTTRTSVFARRKEINIMKYVGATNNFIRIPFFIEGLVLGFVASSIALLLTKYAYEAVYKALTSNITLQALMGTGSIVPFRSILVNVALAYIAAGIILGAFGTVISTRKHLKV